jgi:hypothetical protein
MRKLITAVIVAAALAIPATPAFAIHDGRLTFVSGLPDDVGVGCNPDNTEAIGHPATGKANTAFSNTVLLVHNFADPNCRNGRDDPDN